MKKYGIIALVFIILISVGVNFYQLGEIRRAESQLAIVNNRVLDNIEQYTRWSIRFIDEIQDLKELENEDDFMMQTTFGHLQNSLDDLVEYYAYFVDLRNENTVANGVCSETLESIRSIRNVVNHNLQEKFDMNEHQFTTNDYVFLQNLGEELQGLLSSIYHIGEVNENQLIIVIPQEQEERLEVISSNLGELGSRYRHSILSENREDLLSEAVATMDLKEMALKWLDEEALEKSEIEGVQYRNGTSHYALETKELLLWLDAKDGSLRYLEYSPKNPKTSGKKIQQREALEIALGFYSEVKGETTEDLKQEVFTYNQEGNGETVYAFRFTPMNNNLRLSSDAVEINVGGDSGEVVRFRNRFHQTSVPTDLKEKLVMFEVKDEEEVEGAVIPLSAENIMEIHQEVYPDLDYQGRAVIRNFYTEFQPRVVKVFFQEIDGQRAALYFDEYTGRELERNYYPYESF